MSKKHENDLYKLIGNLKMGKKIYVIGANGYIGSLLVEYLNTAGHEVEVSNYRLPDIPKNVIDTDIVIHLATAGGGTVHKPRFGNDNPEYMKKVNLDGMKNLIKGVKNKSTKILFVSSAAVYGKFEDAPLVGENAPLNPISNYGKDKSEAENILMKSGIDYMILRPCGVFGKSTHNNFGNAFLNKILNNAIENKQIEVFGGEQLIDTVYLLDVINIILRACGKEWKSNAIYNVGGEITSIKNMLEIVANALAKAGINCPLVVQPFNGKPAAILDSSKLKNDFKWEPTALTIAIPELVKGYLNTLK